MDVDTDWGDHTVVPLRHGALLSFGASRQLTCRLGAGEGAGTVKRWVDALKRLIDARREPRRAVAQHARLTVAGKEHQVPLLDISPSGAMVGFDGPIREGETVLIHVLDREPLRGQPRFIG